jgi:hypothetical protein
MPDSSIILSHDQATLVLRLLGPAQRRCLSAPPACAMSLSFTSFRHGGFTETGDAGLTDREIMAQGRHKSVKVLPRYVKRSTDQVPAGAQKRQAARTKVDQSSE